MNFKVLFKLLEPSVEAVLAGRKKVNLLQLHESLGYALEHFFLGSKVRGRLRKSERRGALVAVVVAIDLWSILVVAVVSQSRGGARVLELKHTLEVVVSD